MKRDGICTPGGGTEAEKRFPHSGKPPHQWGNQLGQKGNICGCQRSVKWLVCGRQDRVRPTQTVRDTALHAPDWDMCPLVHTGAESLNVRTREKTQGWKCCWLWGDSLRGQEGGNLQLEMLVEETQTAIEARCHCWVMCRGWSHHCSLSLPTCQSPAPPGTRKSPH